MKNIYSILILALVVTGVSLEAKRGDRYDPDYEPSPTNNPNPRGEYYREQSEGRGHTPTWRGFKKKLPIAQIFWALDPGEDNKTPPSQPQTAEEYDAYCRPIYEKGLVENAGTPNAVWKAYNAMPEGCKTNWYGPAPARDIIPDEDPMEAFMGKVAAPSYIKIDKPKKVKVKKVKKAKVEVIKPKKPTVTVKIPTVVVENFTPTYKVRTPRGKVNGRFYWWSRNK